MANAKNTNTTDTADTETMEALLAQIEELQAQLEATAQPTTNVKAKAAAAKERASETAEAVGGRVHDVTHTEDGQLSKPIKAVGVAGIIGGLASGLDMIFG